MKVKKLNKVVNGQYCYGLFKPNSNQPYKVYISEQTAKLALAKYRLDTKLNKVLSKIPNDLKLIHETLTIS
jgi:hypothetical protein